MIYSLVEYTPLAITFNLQRAARLVHLPRLFFFYKYPIKSYPKIRPLPHRTYWGEDESGTADTAT